VPIGDRIRSFLGLPPEKPVEPNAQPAKPKAEAPSPDGEGVNALKKGEETKALLPQVAVQQSPYSMAMLDFDGVRYNPDDLLNRKGFDIYKRMMLDEQLKAVVLFKIAAIIGRGWTLEYDEQDETLSPEDKEFRIRLFKRIIERMGGSWNSGLKKIMKAVPQGFSMTEKVHDLFEFEGKTWHGLKALKSRPFETFHFETDVHGDIVQCIQRSPGLPDRPIPLNRMIYLVHNSDVDEQYGQSDIREAYRDYFSKDMATRFRNIHLERMGCGLVFFEVEKGVAASQQNSADWNALKGFIRNMSAATGALLPAGVKANVVFPQDTQQFKETIAACNLGMAKCVLVPNLLGITETGQTGAYSQSQTQFEAFLWTLDEGTQELEDAINEQIMDELGRANFADGLAPTFKFKPISENRKLELLKAWGDMLQKGGAEASDTDEKKVREMLDMPPKGEPLKKPGLIDPATGLPIQQPKIGPDGKPLPPDEQPPKLGPDGKPLPPKPGEPKPAPLDETVRGHGMTLNDRAEMVASSEARVHFTVIDQRTRNMEADSLKQLHQAIKAGINEVIATVRQQGADGVIEDMEAIAFTQRSKGAVKRSLIGNAKEAYLLGARLADQEIKQAAAIEAKLTKKEARFTPRRPDPNIVIETALPYLEGRVYTTTGALTTDAENIIRNSVISGIRAGRSIEEIANDAYAQLARGGFLSAEDLAEVTGLSGSALEDLMGDGELSLGRLQTTVRTSVFDAFNEARFDYFTDPALEGFVQAFQYSAVLDEHTTDICSSLNGSVYAADDPVWGSITPPNHFNCRSLLIPIVEGDKWKQSEPPTVDPQKGFG